MLSRLFTTVSTSFPVKIFPLHSALAFTVTVPALSEIYVLPERLPPPERVNFRSVISYPVSFPAEFAAFAYSFVLPPPFMTRL